jgi:uncharacterized protein YecT (DUF1311 family)
MKFGKRYKLFAGNPDNFEINLVVWITWSGALTDMGLKKSLLALLVLCTAAAVNYDASAAEKVHPIDKWTAQCEKNSKSTADSVDCHEQAYKKWDAELNKQYKLLSAELTPAERKNLQATQLQWIKFRDQELKLIDDMYNNHKEGSMYAPMQAASRARIVRERALLLQHYLELLNET